MLRGTGLSPLFVPATSRRAPGGSLRCGDVAPLHQSRAELQQQSSLRVGDERGDGAAAAANDKKFLRRVHGLVLAAANFVQRE